MQQCLTIAFCGLSLVKVRGLLCELFLAFLRFRLWVTVVDVQSNCKTFLLQVHILGVVDKLAAALCVALSCSQSLSEHVQCLLCLTTALIPKKTVLTSNYPYSEVPLQSKCSDWVAVAVS